MGAIRRPVWWVRLRHRWRRNGAAWCDLAAELSLCTLILACTAASCFFLFGLGV